MARVLVGDEWYEPMETVRLYESAFERILLSKHVYIFPGYHAVQFKKTVYSDFDSARADYALIHEQYAHWWVVEVEMAHHSLRHHVMPQVATLTEAAYGSDVAEYLGKQCAQLDIGSVTSMLKGEQPRVLVVVDRPKPEWESPLATVGAALAVFEILRSERDRYIYRFNGYAPSQAGGDVSLCWLDPTIPSLVRVQSPAALGVAAGEKLVIRIEGVCSIWSRLDSSAGVWLVPQERNPLQIGIKYQLSKLNSHYYNLKRCSVS